MPITNSQCEEIIAYAKTLDITSSETASLSYTSSVQNNSPTFTIANPEHLSLIIKKINSLNQQNPHPICATVIGGGRGGNNQSYSLGNIWAGTDLFLQLTWQPTLNLLNEQNNIDGIFRVSPNMMLVELNKYLYDFGYHCPTLYGALPFMSLAGGISTNSHTAYGFLADIVKGVEVILPNGETKYFKNEDEDFATLIQSPSLGMLGIITAIDIQAKKGKKKLQRTNTVSTYHDLVPKIKEAEVKQNLNSISMIFSPVKLKNDRKIKFTSWNWVEDSTPNQGKLIPQSVDNSLATNHLAPCVAIKRPTFFYCFFQQEIMSNPGTTICRPDLIMGPESKIAGKITDMEIFSEYNPERVDEFFTRLLDLFEHQETLKNFPINTAVYIRFPKQQGNDRHYIAIDFISFGSHSQTLKPFVNELASYLQSNDIQSHIHYGKNDAIRLNRRSNENKINWEKLKLKYTAFYQRHQLDKNLLNHKINALEKVHTIKQNTPENDSVICDTYFNYCHRYKRRLETKFEQQLQKYPHLNRHYEIESVDHPHQLNKYDLLTNDLSSGLNPAPFHSKQEIQEKKKMLANPVISKIAKKYNIIKSLKNHLLTEKTPGNRIEDFHKELDHQTKQLKTHRDSTLIKWIGVFAAGLAGLGVFSYWTTRYVYQHLFTTHAEKTIINNVNNDRQTRYSI